MQTITLNTAVNITPPLPLSLTFTLTSPHFAFLFQMGPFVDAKNDLIEVSLAQTTVRVESESVLVHG